GRPHPFPVAAMVATGGRAQLAVGVAADRRQPAVGMLEFAVDCTQCCGQADAFAVGPACGVTSGALSSPVTLSPPGAGAAGTVTTRSLASVTAGSPSTLPSLRSPPGGRAGRSLGQGTGRVGGHGFVVVGVAESGAQALAG